MSKTDPAPNIVHYDAHYRVGGFGYEAQREHWKQWVERHYVRTFDLQSAGRQRWPWRARQRFTLLDVACGNGFWTALFHELGFDAQGIDHSPGGMEMARLRYPSLSFTVADAEKDLPFEKGSFDVVFIRAITHFHWKNLFGKSTTGLVANLMQYVAPSGLMLASYYTKRDGSERESHHYHPVSDLVRLFELAGDVWRVDVADDFVQVGVRHRSNAASA